jgi:hypothetical protein
MVIKRNVDHHNYKTDIPVRHLAEIIIQHFSINFRLKMNCQNQHSLNIQIKMGNSKILIG